MYSSQVQVLRNIKHSVRTKNIRRIYVICKNYVLLLEIDCKPVTSIKNIYDQYHQ